VESRLLINPAAGRGRGARLRARLEHLARASGLSCETSANARDLVERARRAEREGVERLLVAGGDGTWHWAAQGLAGGATALAPIPLGTGNDLARELGYPLAPERAFAAALEGRIERLDLGRIGDEWFCGVAGIGFDAVVGEHARTKVRWLRGPAVYAWSLLVTLATFRRPRVELELPGRRFAAEVYLVAFANTSHYGGGMRIAPNADPTDGLLDVVIVHRTSKWRLLRIFPKVYRGRHLGDPAVEILRAPWVEVRFDPPQAINIDGEGGGVTGRGTLRIEVAPSALAVVRAAGPKS
jgi:diacylglycerol kinase (ATP)